MEIIVISKAQLRRLDRAPDARVAEGLRRLVQSQRARALPTEAE